MESKDVPMYKWFRLEPEGSNKYNYERYLYKTNIKSGSTILHLEVWKNSNQSNYQFSNSFLQEPGFWMHQKERYIKDEFPVSKEKANRECLKSIWENLDQ